MAGLQILIYRKDFNLGDCIQVIAVSRLLPGKLLGVYRDDISEADPRMRFVVNGWLGSEHDDCSHWPNTIFAGIFVGRHVQSQLRWIARSDHPVGARDPYTREALRRHGIYADMIGCATTTFEPYTGPRTGEYSIDVEQVGTIHLTQELPPGRYSWREIWDMTLARLDVLRTAEIVYTNRLHVALPCLAFSTPVVLRRREAWFQPERLSLLDELGVPDNEPITMDLSDAAATYLNWLSARLGQSLSPRDPKFPEPPSDV